MKKVEKIRETLQKTVRTTPGVLGTTTTQSSIYLVLDRNQITPHSPAWDDLLETVQKDLEKLPAKVVEEPRVSSGHRPALQIEIKAWATTKEVTPR